MELARDRVNLLGDACDLLSDLSNALSTLSGVAVQLLLELARLDRERGQPLAQVVVELARQSAALLFLGLQEPPRQLAEIRVALAQGRLARAKSAFRTLELRDLLYDAANSHHVSGL